MPSGDRRLHANRARCEGTPCVVTFVRARWRRRRDKTTGIVSPVEPTTTNVKVIAVKPVGAVVGMGARFDACDKIRERLRAENKVISGRCPGECSCVAAEPDDDAFQFVNWTIEVSFHIGGRDPNDQSDRIDYKATFVARRAEVDANGECQIAYA